MKEWALTTVSSPPLAETRFVPDSSFVGAQHDIFLPKRILSKRRVID